MNIDQTKTLYRLLNEAVHSGKILTRLPTGETMVDTGEIADYVQQVVVANIEAARRNLAKNIIQKIDDPGFTLNELRQSLVKIVEEV